LVIVRVRMVHMAIMVAVLGIVVMIVGVVVHPVHPLNFTRLRRLAQDSRVAFVMMQSAPRVPLLVLRCTTETAKEHRQECLCQQWEV